MIYLDIELPGCPDASLRQWHWQGNLDDFRQLCHAGLVNIFGPHMKPGAAKDMKVDFKRILNEVEKEFESLNGPEVV